MMTDELRALRDASRKIERILIKAGADNIEGLAPKLVAEATKLARDPEALQTSIIAMGGCLAAQSIKLWKIEEMLSKQTLSEMIEAMANE